VHAFSSICTPIPRQVNTAFQHGERHFPMDRTTEPGSGAPRSRQAESRTKPRAETFSPTDRVQYRSAFPAIRPYETNGGPFCFKSFVEYWRICKIFLAGSILQWSFLLTRLFLQRPSRGGGMHPWSRCRAEWREEKGCCFLFEEYGRWGSIFGLSRLSGTVP
jgi:hypothetical protein